jgi:hypothetical protein
MARRRKRKPLKRADPNPAGSPEAIRIVRGFVEQERRVRLSQGEVDAMLRKIQRGVKRTLV